MKISKQLYDEYANSFSAFRRDLQVDANGQMRRYGEIENDFQKKDNDAAEEGLKVCSGRSISTNAGMRLYFERPRGHSKTTDLAVMVVWAMAFATRPIKGYAFAADQDQAKLLKNAVEVILRLNPWLGQILETNNNVVKNTAKGHPGQGATLEISTSDVASSYGILPDFIICDEVTHWEGDGSLWHSIISSAAKRESCLLVCISNAGFCDSWAWAVREAARTSEDWYFSRLDGPQASWITEKTLAEQRRMLPGKAFDRLWLNIWSTAGGDALPPELIERAFHPELSPMSGSEENWSYVAGVDLSKTRDNSAICVLAVPSDGAAGRIRLAYTKVWRPMGGKIDMLEVQRTILSLDKTYGLEFVAFDGYETEHLAQTLEADTDHLSRNIRRTYGSEPWMRTIPPTPANIRQQATLTIEGFNDNRFEFYECEDLRRDLLKLRAEEKSYGIRLTSPRSNDGSGHGDLASAFLVALLLAHEIAGKGGDSFTTIDDGSGLYFVQGKPQSAVEAWAARCAAAKADYEEGFNASRSGNSFSDALAEGRVFANGQPFQY